MYRETAIPDPILDKFTKIDDYICNSLLPSDPSLTSTLESSKASNLDAIDVAPNQGHLLYQLAKLNGSKRILEIGSLGGYSAIWFAKAVGSTGKVVTLEVNPHHAEVASGNISRAGYSGIIDVKVGKALDSLARLATEAEKEIFDFVFIDADKENNVPYFKYALQFARIGTVIVVDNMARRGRLADEDCLEPSVVGTRALFEYLKGERRCKCTAVQTVGSKGWDGFLMATVVA